MQKEIEIKYGEKECHLVFRDKDGNKGLFIENSAGDNFDFIRTNSDSFEKFLSDGYDRAELAEKLIKFWKAC